MACNNSTYSDDMYSELLARFNETRKRNIKLLEERRELLLRLQGQTRTQNQSNELAYGDNDDFASDESNSEKEKLLKDNVEWKRKYEAITSDYAQLQSICEQMKKEMKEDRHENDKLKQLICHLSADLVKLGVCHNPHESGSKNDLKSDEIEALKQQIELYQEDFEHERKDKEKLMSENRLLEGQLEYTSERLEMMSAENRKYRLCLNQVTSQKEHLLSEIRRLSIGSLPFSPVHEHQVPLDTRFKYDSYEGQDIVPKSFVSTAGPTIVKPSPSAFFGHPAVEDSKCR